MKDNTLAQEHLSGRTWAELNGVYERRILPILDSEGGDPAQAARQRARGRKPRVIFIAGQPASLKTSIQKGVMALARLHDPVEIDADEWRREHPDHDRWVSEDSLDAARKEQPVVGDWVDMALEHVASKHYDALVSATFKNPDTAKQKVRIFRGYDVIVVFTAVHRLYSRLFIVQRYLSQNRYVPADIHDEACAGILSTAKKIDEGEFGDVVVRVYGYHPTATTGTLKELYAGRPSRWKGSSQTLTVHQAIEQERILQWNRDLDRFRSAAKSLIDNPRVGGDLKVHLDSTLAQLAMDELVCLILQCPGPSLAE